MKQKTSRLEKAARRKRKIYIMKKSMLHSRKSRRFANFRITSSSSRFAWFELLMNQLGKENVTYLRHPNTIFIEQVTKQILTNILPNYSLQSALPKMFTSRNVNNLVFYRRLWFLRNFKPTSIIFGEDQKENIPFKNVNGVLFYSLQSAPASVLTHWNVDSFISHRSWCFVWLRSASYYNDERSSFL